MSSFYNYTTISYLPSGILRGTIREKNNKYYILDWEIVPRYNSQLDTIKLLKKSIVKGFVDKQNKLLYIKTINIIWK